MAAGSFWKCTLNPFSILFLLFSLFLFAFWNSVPICYSIRLRSFCNSKSLLIFIFICPACCLDNRPGLIHSASSTTAGPYKKKKKVGGGAHWCTKNANFTWTGVCDVSSLWSSPWIFCWCCEVTFPRCRIAYTCGVACVHVASGLAIIVNNTAPWLHTALGKKKKKSIPQLDSKQLEAFFTNSIFFLYTFCNRWTRKTVFPKIHQITYVIYSVHSCIYKSLKCSDLIFY